MTPEEIRRLEDQYAPLPNGPVPKDSVAGRIGKWLFGPLLVQTPQDRLHQTLSDRDLIEKVLSRNETDLSNIPAVLAENRTRQQQAQANEANIPFVQNATQAGLSDRLERLRQDYGGPVSFTPNGVVRSPSQQVQSLGVPDIGPHPGADAPPPAQQDYYHRLLGKDYPMGDQNIIANAGGDQSFVAPMTKDELDQQAKQREWKRIEPFLGHDDPLDVEIARRKHFGVPLSHEQQQKLAQRDIESQQNLLIAKAQSFKKAMPSLSDSDAMEFALGRNVVANRTQGQNSGSLSDEKKAELLMKLWSAEQENGSKIAASPDEIEKAVTAKYNSIVKMLSGGQSKKTPPPQFNLEPSTSPSPVLTQDQQATAQQLFAGAVAPSGPANAAPAPPAKPQAQTGTLPPQIRDYIARYKGYLRKQGVPEDQINLLATKQAEALLQGQTQASTR